MVWAELAFHLLTLQTKNLLRRSEQLVPLSWTFQKTLCDWTWSCARCLSKAVLPFISMWECEGGNAWIVQRVGPVVMVNTAKLWRLESGIGSALGSVLFLVDGTNRKTLWECSCAIIAVTLAHSLTHQHSSRHSLTCSPVSPPITTHFHSSGLVSVWKDEPMWKKNRNPYSISSCCTTERETLIVYSPVQNHNPCFKNEWTPCKQEATCSVVMFASSWWQHSQCVTGIQTSYSVSPFLGNDFLKLATECHSLFFNVFIDAGKVSLPHMKRTSHLHDLFLILCSQNVLHRWNFECFEWSVFGLTWSTYRCCLLPVSCTCPLLFFFLYLLRSTCVSFCMYCENMLF